MTGPTPGEKVVRKGWDGWLRSARKSIHTVADAIHELENACIDGLLLEGHRVRQNDHGHIGHARSSDTLKPPSKKEDWPDWRGSTEHTAYRQEDNGDLQR